MQVSFTIPWLTRKRLLALMPLAVIPVVIFTSASACNGGGAGHSQTRCHGGISEPLQQRPAALAADRAIPSTGTRSPTSRPPTSSA